MSGQQKQKQKQNNFKIVDPIMPLEHIFFSIFTKIAFFVKIIAESYLSSWAHKVFPQAMRGGIPAIFFKSQWS
jgi:hypothetical protein